MVVGKLVLVVNLYIGIPLNMYPARLTITEVLELGPSLRTRYLLCLALALSSFLVAVTFIQVNSYFGLMGGTAGVLIGGAIPAFCFWKGLISKDPTLQTAKNYGIVLFCGAIMILSFLGAILSVVDPA